MNSHAYITSLGTFLPGEPITNDEMETVLGKINSRPSKLRQRVLNQNGIKTRFYAIDKNQKTTHSNAQLAVRAMEQAVHRSSLHFNEIQMLSTGTTQGDIPVPGFASMVHGLSSLGVCELASFQSVCTSGVMALKALYSQIKCGEKENGISVGSELASRLFKASRYETASSDYIGFDAEFLRWMLSDGAGAMIVRNAPRPNALSLRIDWIDIRSHAHQRPTCMYVGPKELNGTGWLDYPDYTAAQNEGALFLRQNVKILDQIVKQGIGHYFDLIDKGRIRPKEMDYLCCHYSSEIFKDQILNLMKQSGGLIEPDKWRSNLTSKGNTGSASIYIALEELFYSGELKLGQKILCMVPESGRFLSSFFQLTVVDEHTKL